MISRNSTREILLNMFDRSKKTAARVGGSPCCSLLLIYDTFRSFRNASQLIRQRREQGILSI